MYRFFENKDFNEIIELNKENSHHYLKVLRIKENEEVEICANNGIFIGNFKNDDNGIVFLNKLRRINTENESKVKLILFQGILKGDKMDQALRQATEVGVDEIYPLKLKRTIANVDQREEKKIQRWQKVVEAASKQSKRDFIPKVNSPIDIDYLVKNFKKWDLIVPYEDEKKSTIFDIENLSNNIGLIIGSEGGFDESEINALKSENAKIITLGNRILRAETAAVCASFSIIYYLESR